MTRPEKIHFSNLAAAVPIANRLAEIREVIVAYTPGIKASSYFKIGDVEVKIAPRDGLADLRNEEDRLELELLNRGVAIGASAICVWERKKINFRNIHSRLCNWAASDSSNKRRDLILSWTDADMPLDSDTYKDLYVVMRDEPEEVQDYIDEMRARKRETKP